MRDFLRSLLLGRTLYSVFVVRSPTEYATVLVTERSKRRAARVALDQRPLGLLGRKGTFRSLGYVVKDVRFSYGA